MSKVLDIQLFCTSDHRELREKAFNLCNKYGFSLSQTIDNSPQLLLTETGLKLKIFSQYTKKATSLQIDFLSGKNRYRFERDRTINQPLAKAMGIVSGKRPDIADVTAGLGQDGFVLASLGCKVTLIERSSVLAALLEDGLARAQQHRSTQDIVTNNIKLLHGNSITLIKSLPKLFHTIYMDPMYPHSKKSALNRIEMRIIRSLVGDDSDAPNLLKAAVKKASNRVVVKRPKGAPELESELKVHHAIKMKNSRFDVYMINHL